MTERAGATMPDGPPTHVAGAGTETAAAGTPKPCVRLFRSASVRFAIIYAVLLALSTAALAYFVWWSTAGLLERQTQSAIGVDAEALSVRWHQFGVPGLVMNIDDRLAQNVDDDAIYMLVDRSGRKLAGNLEGWPAGADEPDVFYHLHVQRAGAPALVELKRYNLPDGMALLIGRDVQVRAQLGNLLTDALLWALVIVCAMASIGALVVRNLFQRSLANVSATAAAIAAGDLGRRVRLSGRGDEFDQLAEVINEMLDRISRLMDGVRQVSNSIAHDLRTPITRARTRLEDAALHAETVEDLRTAVERAIADLDGIVAIFQALLRIAEIESGARRSAFARLDVAPLLTEVAELYQAVADEQQVKLQVEVTGPLPVHGDSTLIQQAVANLVDNAFKFSPPGGTVRLTGAMATRGVTITVSDQGPGIPDAERLKATERFYRGEAARHTPGSGLGLTLVAAVAHLHGGVLELDDASPGLRASLSLPADHEHH
jgi:signal transduction histidine kinase